MRRNLVVGSVLGLAMLGGIGGTITAAPAAAYPVGPYKIQGPCAGKTPQQCPMSPSRDGLTWSFHGDAWNYDKTGRFVCMSSAFYCEPLMAVVRALPPAQFGS